MGAIPGQRINPNWAFRAKLAGMAKSRPQKKLEPPTRAEGFDDIYRVTPGGDEAAAAAFVVEPWPEDEVGS